MVAIKQYFFKHSCKYSIMQNKISIFQYILLIILATAVSLLHYNCDWIPHDEGLIHCGAENIDNGKLPHIDFYAGYTGFLYYYINLLHKIFGNNILSSRYPLILLNAGIIMLVFSIGRVLFRKFSFLVALFCLSWGMNNYFASLPSWYCLFFGLLSLYILIYPYQKKNTLYYLFLSGLVAGVSFLFKQSLGIYNLLAILAYLCSEYLISPRSRGKLSIFLTTCCFAFLATIIIFVTSLTFSSEPIWFTLLLILFFIGTTYFVIKNRNTAQRSAEAHYNFIAKLIVVLSGFIAINVPFFYTYFTQGFFLQVSKLILFTAKSISLKFISVPVYTDISPISIGTLIIMLCSVVFIKRTISKILTVAAPFGIIFILYGQISLFKTLWDLVTLLPVVTFLFCFMFLFAPSSYKSKNNKEAKTFLTLAFFSFFFYLVIVPYGYALYYLYCIPFFIILLVFQVNNFVKNNKLKSIHNVLYFILCFFIVLGFFLNEKYRIQIGGAAPRAVKSKDYELLTFEKGNIYITKYQHRIYKVLQTIINQYTNPGTYIFTYTECPEIYYLFERKNPCWHIYADITQEIESYDDILKKLKEKNVNLIILNTRAESYILSKNRNRFLNELVSLYPIRYQVGRFLVGIRIRDVVR